MRIAVSHLTRLDFGEEVTESVMDARLGPRDDAHQRVRRFQVRLEPGGHVRRYEDGFGNAAHLLTSMRPHTFLQVIAETEIQTSLVDPFQLPAQPPRPLDAIERLDYLDDSPLVPPLPVVRDMAAPFRPRDAEAAFDAVRGLAEMIYRSFAYRQNVTDVTTSIDQVIEGRQGVCQDFAHVLIGLCRAIDIPARYASGYIVPQSHGDDDRTPSRGAGASHAWIEAFTPTHGWRGFDPTNNLVANEHYVKVAIGRDYHDVAPTRGTYHGTPGERLTVAVDVHALD
ncbi:MAG TPA: transglutaminase family protein [Chloroflexota bacterium]|jgi:transglutaminase-like putative cysteine protease